MNQPTCDAIQDAAVTAMFNERQKRFAAELAVKAEIEKKTESGEVLVLSDEEMAMIRSFRRFCGTAKPGKVFRWQVGPLPTSVILPPDEVHIRHPQDLSD